MLIESRELDPGVQPAGAEGGLGGRLASMDGHPTKAIDHRPAGFWKGLETARWQGGFYKKFVQRVEADRYG
jgi:hypothetical protein